MRFIRNTNPFFRKSSSSSTFGSAARKDPLKKNFSQLLQAGVIGYDQWQVTDNGGTVAVGPITAPAKLLLYYSVHAVGGQLNYILPARNFSLFFKYEHEYKSYSHTLGNTVVFGGIWTLRIPKPVATKP